MDMTIYCGKCGKKMTVSDRKAGQKTVCTRCNTKLPLPSQPTDEPQIRLYCYGCGHRVRADVDQSGGEMQCPKCKEVIPLPSIDDSLIEVARREKKGKKDLDDRMIDKDADEDEDDEWDDMLPTRRRRKKKAREFHTADYKISDEMRETIDRIDRQKSERKKRTKEDDADERPRKTRKKRDKLEDSDEFAEVMPVIDGPGPFKVFLITFVVAALILTALWVAYYVVSRLNEESADSTGSDQPDAAQAVPEGGATAKLAPKSAAKEPDRKAAAAASKTQTKKTTAQSNAKKPAASKTKPTAAAKTTVAAKAPAPAAGTKTAAAAKTPAPAKKSATSAAAKGPAPAPTAKKPAAPTTTAAKKAAAKQPTTAAKKPAAKPAATAAKKPVAKKPTTAAKQPATAAKTPTGKEPAAAAKKPAAEAPVGKRISPTVDVLEGPVLIDKRGQMGVDGGAAQATIRLDISENRMVVTKVTISLKKVKCRKRGHTPVAVPSVDITWDRPIPIKDSGFFVQIGSTLVRGRFTAGKTAVGTVELIYSKGREGNQVNYDLGKWEWEAQGK